MSDKIKISGLQLLAFCGITEEEKKVGSKLSVDIELFLDTKKAADTDNLKDTIDYAKVCEAVLRVARNKYNLLETLTEKIASCLLKKFSVKEVKIKVRKNPLLKNTLDYIEIEINRRNN